MNRARRLDRDRFGIAPGARRNRAEICDRFFEPAERNHHRQPSVRFLCGELDALFIQRGDVDRDVLAGWLEAQREPALELEQLAVVVERLPGHQQIHDIDVLAHPRERWIESDAMEVLDHLRSAGTQSDDHASAAQFIERREMLCQCARRARVGVDDSACQLQAPGMLGEQREGGKGVAAPCLGDPDRMHPGLLCGAGALVQPSEVELSLPVDGECNVVTHDGCNFMRADFLLASCCRDCRARALRWGATRKAQTNTEYSRRNNLHAKLTICHAFRRRRYRLNY